MPHRDTGSPADVVVVAGPAADGRVAVAVLGREESVRMRDGGRRVCAVGR